MTKPVVYGLCVSLALSITTEAWSADPPAEAPHSSSTAEKLFLEGRVLSDRGDIAGACLHFETSHQLEPLAVGPTLNLALCKEQLSKFASAAVYFREVIERSGGGRPDRVELARQHLTAIEPKIATVRIEVPAPRPPGLEIRLDEQVVPEAAWGIDAPTDGGAHVLRASAPKKRPVTLSVNLKPEGGRLTVPLPPLEDVRETKTIGYTVGGIGLALVVAGGIVGGSVAARCGGLFQDTCEAANGMTDPARSNTLRSLNAQAWAANAAIGVGLVAVGVGVYFLLTSPKEIPERVLQASRAR